MLDNLHTVFAPDTTATNGQSHHSAFDALSMNQSSRHKNASASTYDPFGNTSHSAAELFGTTQQTHSQRRHSHADLSVLSYGTTAAGNVNGVNAGNTGNANGANGNQAASTSNARNGIRYNGASTTQQNKHNEFGSNIHALSLLLCQSEIHCNSA